LARDTLLIHESFTNRNRGRPKKFGNFYYFLVKDAKNIPRRKYIVDELMELLRCLDSGDLLCYVFGIYIGTRHEKHGKKCL